MSRFSSGLYLQIFLIHPTTSSGYTPEMGLQSFTHHRMCRCCRGFRFRASGFHYSLPATHHVLKETPTMHFALYTHKATCFVFKLYAVRFRVVSLVFFISQINLWNSSFRWHRNTKSFSFHIEVISLWISKQIVLSPTLISSAGIWSIPGDLWLFNLSKASSTSGALRSGTSGSAVCISACPTSLNPCTLNSWEKKFLHLPTILWESATKSSFSSFTILHLGWYLFVKSLMPLYKSLMFWILLLFSSSSILALRYAFFLFLKCLLTSRLMLFRLSTLFWLGSCIHAF